MKIYTILPNVLYQRARTNDFPLEEKQALAKQLNLGLVVGLCSRPDNDWVYAVRRYISYPVPDSKHVGKVLTALEGPLTWAERTIQYGEAVLVYCNAGRNRSSLFSALFLMRVGGYNGKGAAEMVMSARPRAFGSNPAMLEYLLGLP